ncbi:BTB/POZ domain-containing protein 19 [Clonorchis sinensis]|uniref:BTB/POZ domain-containing protein 19 n=1 Tax=Clonorchis sinensis TaxID=79923 RepID=A0A8T1M2A0_CLOSI|nr:BTB/POZ domain-containing protein 19 [Clonorchis sinensis]
MSKEDRQQFQRSSTGTDTEPAKHNGVVLFGSAHTLAKDMSKIVNRRPFSDVVFFVGLERTKVFGHKCILSSRNEVFRRLFESDPHKNSFEMQSSKPVTFLLLLYFLYTNSISFDRLDIYEVFDLLKTADNYKCKELASLAEIQCGFLLDPKNVFEILPAAIHLDLEFLREAALEYIEDHSSFLLNPTNDELLSLTPTAMRLVLERDQLQLDELNVVEVACFWAENFLKRAEEQYVSMERDNSRTSIVQVKPMQEENVQDSSENSQIDAVQDVGTPYSSSYMQPVLEDVAMVMGALRLVLLSPNELARLEEEQLEKRIIPKECFINAWRFLAFQSAQLPSSGGFTPNVNSSPRQGTGQRTHRRKPTVDWSRRTKSFVVKPSD